MERKRMRNDVRGTGRGIRKKRTSERQVAEEERAEYIYFYMYCRGAMRVAGFTPLLATALVLILACLGLNRFTNAWHPLSFPSMQQL